MGPIAFLRHRTLGWSRKLCLVRPGLREVATGLYFAASLGAFSLTFGHGEPAGGMRPAGSSTDAQARIASRPLRYPELPRGRNQRGTEKLVARRGLQPRPHSRKSTRAQQTRLTRSDAPTVWPPLKADPPPADPLVISRVDVSVSDSGARVSWVTNFTAVGQGAYSTTDSPSLWTPVEAPDVAHETTFDGLAGSTDYTLWMQAMDEWGRATTTQLHVRTLPAEPPTSVSTSTKEGAILVNGEPFFPLALWDVCPSDVARRIDDGINLFMGDGCGTPNALIARLRGETFAVTDASNRLSGAPRLIGWNYPDELDGRLALTTSSPDVDRLAVTPPAGLVTFLTLTNHFYSGANPLSFGREIYPRLVSLADVLGFDLYPLQNWCRTDRFGAVYAAQQELETLAAGKPTYQWIEARQMDCAAGSLDPTPATVRAETWLAIAGGADGIGYFPNNWKPDIGAEIRDLNDTITQLAPALLAETVAGESDQDAVKVGARMLNGALYVVAVNSSSESLAASVHVPGLGDRAVDVLGEARQLAPTDAEVLTDSFGPLATHVYVAAPDGWSTAPSAR
jgi:hypothetical protein